MITMLPTPTSPLRPSAVLCGILGARPAPPKNHRKSTHTSDAAANRLASASHRHPHATHQPTDCLILLPQRLPAAVETSIARPTTPPSALSHTRSFNRACAPVRGAQTLIRFQAGAQDYASQDPAAHRVHTGGIGTIGAISYRAAAYVTMTPIPDAPVFVRITGWPGREVRVG